MSAPGGELARLGLEELVEGYLEGRLRPEQEAGLADELRRQPAALEEFSALVQLDDGLRMALAGGPGAEDVARAVAHRLRAAGQSRRVASAVRRRLATAATRSARLRARPRRAGWGVRWAALAAALLLTAGVLARFGRQPRAGAAAALASASGDVRLVRAGTQRAAADGEALLPGDRLSTGADARAAVRYGDGTAVEMNEKTSLGFGGGQDSRRLALASGDIYVRAAGPMTVNAGQYDQVAVQGTQFEVSRSAGSTVLRVAEGRVRLGGGAAVVVGALRSSRVSPGGAPGAPEPVALAAIAPWRDSLARGLVGYWKFDEGSGPRAADCSGRGNHGTLRGATWTSGRLGGAVRCDSGAHVDVGNAPSLRLTQEATVAAWVRILAPADAPAWVCIAGQFQPDRNYNLYVSNQLSIANVQQCADKWRLYLSHQWEQPDYCYSYSDFLLENGAWHHLAGTIDLSAGGSHRYYVDGRPAAESRNLGFDRLFANDADFRLGWGSGSFSGCLDEVRIYRRALSAEEVARLARAPAGAGASGGRQ